MTVINFDYRPLPVHTPFHTSTAYERHLFGAFGSGKTYALNAEAIAWCLEQPGIRGLITRRTIPELRDTTETVFFDILPNELYKAGEAKRIGGHYESFTFPNGSKVLFRGIDDWQKHKSLNVGYIAWDEADEFDEETFQGMASRVRQRDPTKEGKRLGVPDITRRGMWTASNPAGKNWLYRRAVDPATRKDNADWFRSTSFDNVHLPPEYIEELLSYPEPWIRRYVLCQFDDFSGQIYESWGWDSHVIEPFSAYPRGSVFWMGFDPGTRNNNAGLWVYVDQAKRRLIGVAEYQEDGMSAEQHARAWRRIEAQHKMTIRWRVADPATVNLTDRGSNMTLHDIYRRLGYYFNNGPRHYRDRIPMLGNLIEQKRFVVTRACPQTYEQIKNYKWEDMTPAQRAKGLDPREVPVKRDDHLVDCAQYLASRWLRPPKSLDKSRPEQTFSDEVWDAVRKQNRQRRFNARSPNTSVGVV